MGRFQLSTLTLSSNRVILAHRGILKLLVQLRADQVALPYPLRSAIARWNWDRSYQESAEDTFAPAIALTGFGMQEDVTRVEQAGFNAHLTKPHQSPEI